MLDNIILCLTTALMILGIWITLQEGMVFYRFRTAVLERLPWAWIRKPLYECVICMTSFHGIWIWFAVWQGGVKWELIPYLLTVCGILTLISFSIGE